MKIDFGRVEKFIKDKGFGFVSHTLNHTSGEVFFHIRSIRRTQPEIAKSLENEDSLETVYFWYEFEDSNKGEQVKSVLSPDSIHKKFKTDLPILIEKIERIWKDVYPTDSTCLSQASEVLLGVNRTIELSTNRKVLEIKDKEEYLKKLIKEENLRKTVDYESVILIDDMSLKIQIVNTKDRLLELQGNKYKFLGIV